MKSDVIEYLDRTGWVDLETQSIKHMVESYNQYSKENIDRIIKKIENEKISNDKRFKEGFQHCLELIKKFNY